jgi:hypothetical protein
VDGVDGASVTDDLPTYSEPVHSRHDTPTTERRRLPALETGPIRICATDDASAGGMPRLHHRSWGVQGVPVVPARGRRPPLHCQGAMGKRKNRYLFRDTLSRMMQGEALPYEKLTV